MCYSASMDSDQRTIAQDKVAASRTRSVASRTKIGYAVTFTSPQQAKNVGVKGVPPMPEHRAPESTYDAPSNYEKRQFQWANGSRVEIDHSSVKRKATPLPLAHELPHLAGGGYV